MNSRSSGANAPGLARGLRRQARGNSARSGPAWALALVLGLAACDDASGVSSGAYVERAAAYFEQADYPAGVIELKNALQLDPRHLEARLLLGQAYLELGDSTGAEKELRRARALGRTDAEVIGALGRSLLNQARYGDVLVEFRTRPEDPEDLRATVYALRGHALHALGQYSSAARQFSRALELDPEYVNALVGTARVAIRRHSIEEAQRLFARAAQIDPSDPDVLSLGGDLDLLGGRYAEAESTFQSLAESRPGRLEYRLPLAFARIAHGKAQQAVEDLAPVLKVAPDHIGANYLRALAAFSAHDYEVAKTFSDKVLAENVEHVPAKLLAGAASFALDENEQAFRLLAGYLGDVPSDTAARQLLGATIQRIGQPEVSVAQFKPIIDPSLDPAQLMEQVAEAAVRSGYRIDTFAGFHRAALDQPDSSEVLTDLGTLSLDEGNTAKAIEEFEKALEQNPGYDRALVGVVLARVKAGQLDDALTAAERFRDAYPDRPLGPTLVGIIHAIRGEQDAARAAFARALEIRPGAPDAGTNLATLEMQRGETTRARALLYDVLRANPGHMPALMRLTQLETLAGQPTNAVAWVEKAIENNPTALEPKVLLARVHLQSRNPRKALDLTAPLLGSHPGNLALREVIGRAQLMLGRAAEAVLTLRPLAEAMAESTEAQILLAAAYRAARDQAGVRRQLNRVLEIDPGNVGAKVQLASILAAEGELDRAEELVAELRVDGQERSDVLELAGGLALLRNRPADAVAAFEAALAKGPTSALAMKLAMAQQRAGTPEEAVATLQDWISRSPEDVNARSLLGVQYVSLNRLDAAEAAFLEMLEIDPDNSVAFNNLAMVAHRLGRTDDALTYGRRAAELAPDDPAVMDTLGTALLGAGEVDEALSVLEKAAQGLPDNPEVRYHLAQALARSGEVTRARDVLRAALAGEQPFDERAEAEKLLKVLEN